LKEKTIAKKTKTKVGIKDPNARPKRKKKKPPAGKPPERIRMLMSLANQDRAYITGKSYRVPHEVPVKTARAWLESGAAEEDTSLDVPKETK